ncbi:unnamed protein product, partial [Owenia fusiformis]
MAILGPQLVITMVMASFLQKLFPLYSFARWLLSKKLVRYLHPTDDELKKLAGIPANSYKGKGRKREKNKDSEPFTVPKSLELDLDKAEVVALDMFPLHYYKDYQWLMDFSLCALLVYLMAEAYYFFLPQTEFNLSALWVLLGIGFALKILASLTGMYFRTEESGERIMCIAFGFFFLVMAMGVMLVDESKLEFGLDEAYKNFSINAEEFLKHQGIDSSGPASKYTFKIIIAFISAIVGALLTFPGLRYAKMHVDSLRYSKGSYFKQIMLYINFTWPMLVALMWVKPIMRDFIFLARLPSGEAFMTSETFETFRFGIIIGGAFLRLTLLTTHLQSHLNLAYLKVVLLRKEAGRISSLELQRMISRVFYYLCVVALQYIAPVILILFSALLMKSLGQMNLVRSTSYFSTAIKSETVITDAAKEMV